MLIYLVGLFIELIAGDTVDSAQRGKEIQEMDLIPRNTKNWDYSIIIIKYYKLKVPCGQ